MTGCCTDMGLGIRHFEAVSHGSREHSARRCCQSSTTVLVLCWRGQAGQVLGSGVQQGICSLFSVLFGHSVSYIVKNIMVFVTGAELVWVLR